MNNQHTNREAINWHTKTMYVDIETGEILSTQDFKENYVSKHSKTKTNVYRNTGWKTIIHECSRKSAKQLTINW